MKLYKAKCELNVVFFSEFDGGFELRDEALKWAMKNEDNCGVGKVDISEVNSLNDLPKEWSVLSVPWGAIEVTCGDWFNRNKNKKFVKINSLKAKIARLTEELDSLTAETADTN